MTDPILAKAFACADETEQANMINSFSRELFVVCGGRQGVHGFEGQICALSSKLNKDGKQLIKELYAFIKLREEDMEQ